MFDPMSTYGHMLSSQHSGVSAASQYRKDHDIIQ